MKGISTFFFFAIPAVLGLAALYWLAFGKGLHYFKRELSQEKRHAEIVGAPVIPTTKALEIRISDARDAAVRVDRAHVDGGDLWIYYKNVSHEKARHIRFSWKLIAPDGTIVKALEGYTNVYAIGSAPDELGPGERAELHLRIDADPRAVILDLHMESEP